MSDGIERRGPAPDAAPDEGRLDVLLRRGLAPRDERGARTSDEHFLERVRRRVETPGTGSQDSSGSGLGSAPTGRGEAGGGELGAGEPRGSESGASGSTASGSGASDSGASGSTASGSEAGEPEGRDPGRRGVVRSEPATAADEEGTRDVHGSSWLRTAAAMLPPVMVGGLKSPVGVKLGWKVLPLAVTLPLAMLVGVVAIAWFGLRSIGRPDASRVREAREQLDAHVQWGSRLGWAWPLFLGVAPLVVLSFPAHAFGLFALALLVYLLVVVTELSRHGRADRGRVGVACAVALLFGALQINSFTIQATADGAGIWRVVAPIVLVAAGVLCGWMGLGLPPFGKGRIRIPGLGDLGGGERAIAVVGLALGLLPIAAALAFAFGMPIWERVQRVPLAERLPRAFDDAGEDLHAHLLRNVADPVATAALDFPLEGLEPLVRVELGERFPNEAVLQAAAHAGVLPSGSLERFRDPAMEASVRGLAADQAVPGFRLRSEELLAWICAPALAPEERDALAAALARSIPQAGAFGALQDARFLVWSLDTLGRPDLVESAGDRLCALLAGHWLLDHDPDEEPGFSVGPSREGRWIPSGEADFHAAVLIERVGAPDAVDVEALRDRLDTEVAKADGRSTGYVSSRDFFHLASQRILDRALGPRDPGGVAGVLLGPRDLLVALVIALFAVVVTWRAPVRERVESEASCDASSSA